jgi:hypothetical protein
MRPEYTDNMFVHEAIPDPPDPITRLHEWAKQWGFRLLQVAPEEVEGWGGHLGYYSDDNPNCRFLGFTSLEKAIEAWLRQEFNDSFAAMIMNMWKNQVNVGDSEEIKLLKEIKVYLSGLAPHIKSRQQVQLLKRAAGQIEKLMEQIAVMKSMGGKDAAE